MTMIEDQIEAEIKKMSKMQTVELSVAIALLELASLPTDDQRRDLIQSAMKFHRLAVIEDFIKLVSKKGKFFRSDDGAEKMKKGLILTLALTLEKMDATTRQFFTLCEMLDIKEES